jgi:enamine deaminase RidA (YjgF/YER057c/UK114 family)
MTNDQEENIIREEAGGSLGDVVRTRIMLKDISKWEDAAKVHGEIFSKIRPACTFVGIKDLSRGNGWLKQKRTALLIVSFQLNLDHT